MRSWRLLATSVTVDEVAFETSYADVFVVQREGDDRPGPNDWEVTLHSVDRQRLAPGTYALSLRTVEDHTLAGPAILRFSDGQRHLFRGDGTLSGTDAALA
ncbi:MAG TPA: hypothetical protein VK007_11795 [Acidimicrobiales bacterium]|nr:hypothetical protein [Acidimicrobiales bacterium]